MDVLDILSLPVGSGLGTTEVVSMPNPGAGNPASRTVASGYMERVLCLALVLTTNATVGNRNPLINFIDASGLVFCRSQAAIAVPASQTNVIFGAFIGGAQQSPSTLISGSFGLPNILLRPGFVIQVTASFLQAGDAITSVNLMVDRLPIGPDGYQVGEPAPEPAPARRRRRVR